MNQHLGALLYFNLDCRQPKELPVLQCERCSEYLLEDRVMERVETMIGKVDKGAELEIVRYAA